MCLVPNNYVSLYHLNSYSRVNLYIIHVAHERNAMNINVQLQLISCINREIIAVLKDQYH